MAKVDLKIKSTTPTAQSQTTTISYVNPALTNAKLSELAHNLNALTENIYGEGQKVTTVNVDSEVDKQTPTLKLTTGGQDATTINGDGQTVYTLNYSGDGDVFFTILPQNTSGTIEFYTNGTVRSMQISKGTGTKFSMYSTETASYSAARIDYNFA